jgi:deoxycytidine triphosphate deaminase
MPIGQLIYFEISGDFEVLYSKKKSAKYKRQAERPVESMMWKNFR